MSAITFDALTFVKKLKSVGVSEAHAEVEAQAFMDLVEQLEDNHVTKTDLQGELKRLESHLIIRLASSVGIMLSIAVAILALIIKL